MIYINRSAAFTWCLALILLLFVSSVYADRLPNETPENQIFSIDSLIDSTGPLEQSMLQSWVLASPDSIPTGILGSRQSIADTVYMDYILTNGGRLSLNKNYKFDSKNKKDGLSNIETEKVLTYASTEGAHLVGEEEFTLSIAGNYATVGDSIRCVFSTNHGAIIPAFCNAISARSALININSAQVSTKANSLTVAAGVGVPTTFNYQIAVSPDANGGSGFAEGTVKTVFAGSIMEARDGGATNYASSSPTWNKTSAENTWKDSTEVTGGIKNFRKALGDPSGFKSGIFGPLDNNEEEPEAGFGTIHVAYDQGAVGDSFWVYGPNGLVGTGTSESWYYHQPAGTYTFYKCNTDSPYGPPQTLQADATITFTQDGC